MKMRVTAMVPVEYEVSPAQMSAYLKARGWKRLPIEAQPSEYWYNAANVEAFVPTRTDARDWPRRTAELLNTLAAVECRSTGEILRDMAGMEEA